MPLARRHLHTEKVSLRQAWDLPILNLAEKDTKLPFDTSARHTIFYDLNDCETAIDQLSKALRSIKRKYLRRTSGWPPPCSKFFAAAMEKHGKRYALDAVFAVKRETIQLVRNQFMRIKLELEQDFERGKQGTRPLSVMADTVRREQFDLRGRLQLFEMLKKTQSENTGPTNHCDVVLQGMRVVLDFVTTLTRFLESAGMDEQDAPFLVSFFLAAFSFPRFF